MLCASQASPSSLEPMRWRPHRRCCSTRETALSMIDYPCDISRNGHHTWHANRSAHVVCCVRVVWMTVASWSFPAKARQAISTRDELYRGLSSLTTEACATQLSRMPSYVMSCSVLLTFFCATSFVTKLWSLFGLVWA